MFESKIYKKYYPIINSDDFKNWEEGDIECLWHWIKGIDLARFDVSIKEPHLHKGLTFEEHTISCRLSNGKNLKDLRGYFKNNQFIKFDDIDIDFLNHLICSHKYIWPFSRKKVYETARKYYIDAWNEVYTDKEEEKRMSKERRIIRKEIIDDIIGDYLFHKLEGTEINENMSLEDLYEKYKEIKTLVSKNSVCQ